MGEPENKHVALAQMVSAFAQENNLSVVFWCNKKENIKDPNVTFVIENMNAINAELWAETIISQQDVFSKLMEVLVMNILGENKFSADTAGVKHVYTKKQ